MFYPDVKPHISPSALATWHNNRSSFITSYFKGIHTPETAAMKGGTKIHGLLEGGFLTATKRYGNEEKELVWDLGDTGVKVLGKPDDYGYQDPSVQDLAAFVDHKTGGDSVWTKAELAADLKMRTTAWLVWKQMGKPEKGVIGYIEWFGTKWDGETKEVVPTNEDHAVFHYHYTVAELVAFEEIIAKTVADVNAAYDRFMSGTDTFVDEELCREYAELDAQAKALEEQHITPLKERMDAIKETLTEQLAFGGVQSHETGFGTFYFRDTKKYEYPDDLEFQTEDGALMTLAVGEQVATAMSAAKKHYELSHEPADVRRSLQFRAKRK